MELGIKVFGAMGNHWYPHGKLCAQQESILGAPLEINGVHIVVGVNIIPHVRPAVIYMPCKSTLPHEIDGWSLHGRLE